MQIKIWQLLNNKLIVFLIFVYKMYKIRNILMNIAIYCKIFWVKNGAWSEQMKYKGSWVNFCKEINFYKTLVMDEVSQEKTLFYYIASLPMNLHR